MNDSIQCPGFMAAGIAAGLKKHAALDLGLLYSLVPATASGVFTRNRVQAAPVQISIEHLADGHAQAVVANAGNANCCTGAQGMTDARTMCDDVAAGLNLEAKDTLVASTGVIGQPLPMDKLQAALPDLVAALGEDGFEAFAQAIMTTDTVPKLVQHQCKIDGRTITLIAAAKGAGMIRPDMATMLCFMCTDAGIATPLLQQMVRNAVDRTLNRITIDGDTSTNDMVLILANGVSGVVIETEAQQQGFQAALDDILQDVARRMVKDGEGVTKVVDLKIQGVASDHDAQRIADTIAHSPLVKTAFFGEDANWGRILAAVGRAGVPMDPDKVDIYFDQIQMVQAGRGCGSEAEAQVTAVLKQPEFSVTVDLNTGNGRATMLTCDLSVEYVRINADYRT